MHATYVHNAGLLAQLVTPVFSQSAAEFGPQGSSSGTAELGCGGAIDVEIDVDIYDRMAIPWLTGEL